MSPVVEELREMLADGDTPISNEFLRRLLEYIKALEQNQK